MISKYRKFTNLFGKHLKSKFFLYKHEQLLIYYFSVNNNLYNFYFKTLKSGNLIKTLLYNN